MVPVGRTFSEKDFRYDAICQACQENEGNPQPFALSARWGRTDVKTTPNLCRFCI